jgi:hypothetical protein
MPNLFEKPPTPPPEKPEEEKKIGKEAAEGEVPEKKIPEEEVLKEKAKKEVTAEKTAEYLSPDNQKFFNRMSEGGKDIANRVYEGIYKIPGINRVVGKLEIAYNQFWLDRHEKKAVGFKNKMDALDLKIGSFEQSKKEIESVIEDLKQQNIPGVESLQLKLKDIERQKMDLLNEKDKVQTKFEARENKMKLYANERDRIADKLIERYNEKLKPMEKELENLQTYRDEIDLLSTVTEVKHKEQIAKLEDIEKTKTKLEEGLRKAGMSERKIRKDKAVRTLEEFLAQGRERIKVEKENLAKRKAEIEKRIAKVDAKANPYRDKREEFVRVKQGRPLKMEVKVRERGKEFKGEEETRAHPRRERLEAIYPSEEALKKPEVKAAEEDKERLKISSYISGWDAYLQEKYGKDASNEMIDLKDFLKASRLSRDYKLDFNDFKNILAKYCKFRKMPTDKLNKSIDKFFEEKIKAGK